MLSPGLYRSVNLRVDIHSYVATGSVGGVGAWICLAIGDTLTVGRKMVSWQSRLLMQLGCGTCQVECSTSVVRQLFQLFTRLYGVRGRS